MNPHYLDETNSKERICLTDSPTLWNNLWRETPQIKYQTKTFICQWKQHCGLKTKSYFRQYYQIITVAANRRQTNMEKDQGFSEK